MPYRNISLVIFPLLSGIGHCILRCLFFCKLQELASFMSVTFWCSWRTLQWRKPLRRTSSSSPESLATRPTNRVHLQLTMRLPRLKFHRRLPRLLHVSYAYLKMCHEFLKSKIWYLCLCRWCCSKQRLGAIRNGLVEASRYLPSMPFKSSSYYDN